jgi:hypothetical protein
MLLVNVTPGIDVNGELCIPMGFLWEFLFFYGYMSDSLK